MPASERLTAFDFEASRQAATGGLLARYRLVHFATHGVLNTDYPALSGLVLSLVDERGEPREGFLRVHDIYGLELGADLVTLSACETALGREIRGEGLVGLARGFMYAGAARVVASLWSVQDRATAETMRRFYEGILAQGLAPARAFDHVADVRTLGAIGVIELREPVDLRTVQPLFVERGVWVRPFGNLVYCMPPYVMGSDDAAALTAAMVEVVAQLA